jgi:hypothetical protein
MNSNFTRRITTTIAGTAFSAAIFAGITFAGPAGASTAGPTSNMATAGTTVCTTPKMVSQPSISGLNPLTRVAQVQAIAPSPVMRNLGVSCLSN